MADPARLAVHTITTRPLSLKEAVAAYTAEDIAYITVWREHVEACGEDDAARMLADSPLKVAGLCRGGFFPANTEANRQKAIDDNRKAIDLAATLGAPVVVLVCGAVPGMPLSEGRRQIQAGIESILPHAQNRNVRLAIEPLHPMYADDRSAVSTLAQANDMVEAIADPHVGIALDVYHVWWDDALEAEIQRAGDRIFAFHVCDWRTPTRHLLTDRGLMGEGCIDIVQICAWVEAAGFTGPIEVEIFSDDYWSQDQRTFLRQIKRAYTNHV